MLRAAHPDAAAPVEGPGSSRSSGSSWPPRPSPTSSRAARPEEPGSATACSPPTASREPTPASPWRPRPSARPSCSTSCCGWRCSISIPLAGLHPIYVVAALVGPARACSGRPCWLTRFTRGGERAVRVVRAVGRRIPRVGADRLERLVRQVGDSVVHLAQDRDGPQAGGVVGRTQLALRRGLAVGVRRRLRAFRRPGRALRGLRHRQCAGRHPHHPGRPRASSRRRPRTLLVSFGVTKQRRHPGRARLAPRELLAPHPRRRRAPTSRCECPAGSGLRAQRQALVDMAAEAKRPGQEPEPDPTAEDATP